MKIRIHYATNNEPKFVIFNSDKKMMYENLTYTDSLIDTGSASFVLVPTSEAGTGDIDTDLAGLEYVYLENDDGVIVWGGIIVSMTGGKDRLTVNCLGIKYALELVKLSSPYSASGNALTSIAELLVIAKAKRELPFLLDSNSDVVDDTALDFTTGKSIYGAIKEIVEAAYLRFIVTYEKEGVTITPRVLVRSIIGVSPEGVGINRGLESTETNDKVQLKYNINSPKKSNILDFNVNYDLRGMVTKGKVIGKISGVPTEFDSSASSLSSILEFYFGAIERSEVNYEIGDTDTGTAVAEALVNNASFRVDVTFEDSYGFEIQVGDRVSLSISTKLFKIVSLDDQGIETPVTTRVEEKNVSYLDGYRLVTLKLNSNNSKEGFDDIISNVNRLNKQGQSLTSRFIAS